MGNTGSSFFWPNRDPGALAAGFDQAKARQNFLQKVDESGFNWLVFIVAASGFFTDSYNLFASNVVLPALAYVYWDGAAHDSTVPAFNLATLSASAVGQLTFGYLSDRYGRRSLYGIELIIVIISTIGLLQCSNGYSSDNGQHTWNIDAWIIFWRTVMGIGIGAEYPLSACIAAEWSSTQSRGRMIASVFLMQPLGQLCAYGAGLTALRAFDTSSPATKVEIDKLWRYVVGIGAFPTLLALGFRLYMPESGRYTYEVRGDAVQHADDTVVRPSTDSIASDQSLSNDGDLRSTFSFGDLWKFLFQQGHWIDLFGTSMCWLLLDFAFYGLGFNNPSMLAKLWTSRDLTYSVKPPYWLATSGIVNATVAGVEIVNGAVNGTSSVADALIGTVLESNMLHAIYTVSIASILGSILVIILINRFDRKHMLTITFCLLAAVLFAACGSFKALFHHGDLHVVLIMFWVVISFLFSFGPNTLTFIIPAEIFPTRFRCTLYGVAAAFGKLGAIIVQIVIAQVPSIGDTNSSAIRWLLLSFAICMLLGALCSHYFVPHVQRRSTDRDATIGKNDKRRLPPPYVNIPLQDLPLPRKNRSNSVELDNLQAESN